MPTGPPRHAVSDKRGFRKVLTWPPRLMRSSPRLRPLITWRSGPSKWQPREASRLSPPVGAQHPLVSASHPERRGRPCPSRAKGNPQLACCWGRAAVRGQAVPSPASQVKGSSPVSGIFNVPSGSVLGGSLLFRTLVGPGRRQVLSWAWGVRGPKPGGPSGLALGLP